MSVAAIHLKVEDPTPTPQPAKRLDFSPTPRAALTVGYEEEAAAGSSSIPTMKPTSNAQHTQQNAERLRRLRCCMEHRQAPTSTTCTRARIVLFACFLLCLQPVVFFASSADASMCSSGVCLPIVVGCFGVSTLAALAVLFIVSHHYRIGSSCADPRVSAALDYFPGDLVGQAALSIASIQFPLVEGLRSSADFAYRPARLAIACSNAVALVSVAALPYHRSPLWHNLSAVCIFFGMIALSAVVLDGAEGLDGGPRALAWALVAVQGASVFVLVVAVLFSRQNENAPWTLCVMGYMEWLLIVAYCLLQGVLLLSHTA